MRWLRLPKTLLSSCDETFCNNAGQIAPQRMPKYGYRCRHDHCKSQPKTKYHPLGAIWSLKHYFLFVYVISILFLPASFLWVTPEEPELTVINVIFERLSFPRRPTEVGPSYTTFTVLSLNRVAGFPHGGHFSSRFGRVGSNIAKSRQWRFHSVSGMAEVNTMNWSIELSLLEVWGFDWLDMGRRGGQPRSRTSCHTNQLSAIRSRLLSFNAVLVHCT